MFIAIDLKNLANFQKDLSKYLESEIGVAVLDSKDLYSVPSAELISTYNFASGCPEYQQRARRKFLFGESVAITQTDMIQNIESLLPTGRHIVFLGHDIRHDLRALNLLGFDFSKFSITTLDTKGLSHDDSPTLQDLLLKLGCPFAKLHCGGNDANFTMKALLLLAIRDCITQPGLEKKLAILEQIALQPLPYNVQLQTGPANFSSFCLRDPHIKAMKKKAKRLQRSRKQQSKLWDCEMQDNIRAER